jgi:hypothetical protein
VVRIGDRGRTISSLHPQGSVRVNGERYDARADYSHIEADSEVVVLGGDLHGLMVRKIEPGQEIGYLPNHGKTVPASFGEVVALQERHEKDRHEEWQARKSLWRARRRTYGNRRAPLLGLLCATAGLLLSWELVTQVSEEPWQVAVVVEAIGVLWALSVFHLVDRVQQWLLASTLQRMEEKDYDRVALVSTGMGMLGATAGATLAVPNLGLGAGFGLSLLATCVLALLVPAILALHVGSED